MVIIEIDTAYHCKTFDVGEVEGVIDDVAPSKIVMGKANMFR